MQPTKSKPASRPLVHKTLTVTVDPTPSAKPAPQRASTWSDQMHQIDRLEDPERWDGMN